MKYRAYIILLFLIITINSKTVSQVKGNIEYITTSIDTFYYDNLCNLTRMEKYIISETVLYDLSYSIEYKKVTDKNGMYDSILTCYSVKNDSLFPEKVITRVYDRNKKLITMEQVEYLDSLIIYPKKTFIIYKYDRKSRLSKKIQGVVKDKRDCDIVDVYSYGDGIVNVINYLYSHYNSKGRRLLIPKREYHFHRTCHLNNKGLVTTEIEENSNGEVLKTEYKYDIYNNLLSKDCYSVNARGDSFLLSSKANEYIYETGMLMKIVHKVALFNTDL